MLDVDSPYEEVEPIFLELVERLGIKGYECGKTKSGNFRAIIYLEPLRIEVKVKKGKKEIKKVKTFYLRPNTRAKNGHTHLQNAKEIMAIINAYFRKKGLKADDSFKRLNHPVWLGKDFYKRERKKTGETKLYDLYRAVKKLQAEEGLWETNKEFWKEKYKQEKKGKVVIPSFVAKREVKILDDLEKWKIAVRSLAEKYTSYRFTKVMMPAVGWAKDLGLPESEVYDYLRELLPDKRNFDEDFEKAYRYANCTFEWKGQRTGKDEDLSTEKLVIMFLKKAKGGTLRQTLLKEVFKGKNYLLQRIEKFLIESGYVYVRKEKIKRGKGRKAYIYYLTEKGKAFLEALEEGQSLRQARKQAQTLEKAVGEDGVRKPLNINELKKSIYITPPYQGEQDEWTRSCVHSDGLGVGGEKLAKREGLVSPPRGRGSERFRTGFERIPPLTPADTPPDGKGRPLALPAETPDPEKDKTLDHDLDPVPDPDEDEREILLKLGLSADEVEEYLRLSDEGRLEFLEGRNLLEAFQDALEEATAGGEDGEEKKIPPDPPDLPEEGDEDDAKIA
ncbi:MAG: hypothetical protein DSY32_04940 [Aquifex sp.]|nr:MAG: hypothetical protein DSY32_04940 [Aquifex sp.]